MDVVRRGGLGGSACPRRPVPRGKEAWVTSQLDGDESAKGFWGRVGRQPDSGRTRLAKRTPARRIEANLSENCQYEQGSDAGGDESNGRKVEGGRRTSQVVTSHQLWVAGQAVNEDQ